MYHLDEVTQNILDLGIKINSLKCYFCLSIPRFAHVRDTLTTILRTSSKLSSLC